MSESSFTAAFHVTGLAPGGGQRQVMFFFLTDLRDAPRASLFQWYKKCQEPLYEDIGRCILPYMLTRRVHVRRLRDGVDTVARHISQTFGRPTVGVLTPALRSGSSRMWRGNRDFVAHSALLREGYGRAVAVLMVSAVHPSTRRRVERAYTQNGEEITELLKAYSVDELGSGEYDRDLAETLEDIVGSQTLLFHSDVMSSCYTGRKPKE